MNRHSTLIVLLLFTVAAGGCSTNLGLGEPDCSPPAEDVSSSNVMTVQAVPTAKYTPCLQELRLGWDSVEWFAENGRAGIDTSLNSMHSGWMGLSMSTPISISWSMKGMM